MYCNATTEENPSSRTQLFHDEAIPLQGPSRGMLVSRLPGGWKIHRDRSLLREKILNEGRGLRVSSEGRKDGHNSWTRGWRGEREDSFSGCPYIPKVEEVGHVATCFNTCCPSSFVKACQKPSDPLRPRWMGGHCLDGNSRVTGFHLFSAIPLRMTDERDD